MSFRKNLSNVNLEKLINRAKVLEVKFWNFWFIRPPALISDPLPQAPSLRPQKIFTSLNLI